MIDKITSVFENYSTKIKNPLFGTIISVWLIHNWRIPFALFNFDKECTMQDKVNFIADYFGKQNFWEEVVNIIGYSFLVLIFSFILLMISRTITDSYYKIFEPFIVTKIDKKQIFTKVEKNKLEKKIIELENSLNNKREEITRSEGNNQVMQQKRDLIQNEYATYISTSQLEYKNLQDKMNSLVQRSLYSEKITTFYDDIIHLLTTEEIGALKYIIDNDNFLSGRVYSASLNSLFSKHYFLNTNDLTNIQVNQNGILFIGYYKEKLSPIHDIHD